MIRDLGPFIPHSRRLDPAILTMLFNGLQDRHQGRVFVVQVGAGTGEGVPPLQGRFREEGWSGLLIEPLPRNFARLEDLHRDSERVAVLNLGISDAAANLPLHALSPEAEGRNRRFRRGRASLTRDRIAVEGTTPDDIVEVEVPFLRMDTVLQELGIDSAQLLAINVGGHEEQVLHSFDLSRLGASLVLVHAKIGTASDEACVDLLTQAGFLPFRIAGWLVGLSPSHLAVPLEELLAFFGKGLGQPQDAEE